MLCDERAVSKKIAATLITMSADESNVDVLSQLASSARRLPAADGLAMLKNLAGHDEVAGDVHLPLLIWWGIEAKAESDREAVLTLFDAPTFWRQPLVRKYLVERMLQRYAAAGGRANLMSCVRLFQHAPDAESTRLLVKGFRTGVARPNARGIAERTRRYFGPVRGKFASAGRPAGSGGRRDPGTSRHRRSKGQNCGPRPIDRNLSAK